MPSFLSSLVGSKPVVPNLPVLNLGTEAAKATSANTSNLPGAETLVSKANTFSEDQITQMLNQAIPGYSGMVTTASENIASEIKGEIPADVQAQIENSDAARALGGGYGGSGAHGSLVARDLGLTSLNLTQQGLNSFENWTKTSASLYEPSMMSVESMFISPDQQYQADNEQNMQQFQAQWMRNQIAAMPAPWAEDLKQFVYRAMSAYSGTSVENNPYSTPGSFGGGPSAGAGEGGASFDFGGSNYSTTFQDSSGNDPGNELGLGSFG